MKEQVLSDKSSWNEKWLLHCMQKLTDFSSSRPICIDDSTVLAQLADGMDYLDIDVTELLLLLSKGLNFRVEASELSLSDNLKVHDFVAIACEHGIRCNVASSQLGPRAFFESCCEEPTKHSKGVEDFREILASPMAIKLFFEFPVFSISLRHDGRIHWHKIMACAAVGTTVFAALRLMHLSNFFAIAGSVFGIVAATWLFSPQLASYCPVFPSNMSKSDFFVWIERQMVAE